MASRLSEALRGQAAFFTTASDTVAAPPRSPLAAAIPASSTSHGKPLEAGPRLWELDRNSRQAHRAPCACQLIQVPIVRDCLIMFNLHLFMRGVLAAA